MKIFNLLTFDIEDWFHTSALEKLVSRDKWERFEPRVIQNTRRILETLDVRQTKATFFILGWIAERYPELIKEIAACGHEIASHGYLHRLIYNLSPETFRNYVHKSKSLLEDLIGLEVLGYRATSFSITNRTLWALDIIREAGFVYDSSMFPIRHDIYGIDGFPRFPFRYKNGLIEVPASTIRIMGINVPIAGGGYFRFFPYLLTRKGIEKINREGYPAMIYLHPWEMDPDCPRITNLDWRTGFRQYVNLWKVKKRLLRLLEDCNFMPIKDYLKTLII